MSANSILWLAGFGALHITGIEQVESKSIESVALIKLQFHPGTNMAQGDEFVHQLEPANRFRIVTDV
jgi:hypothetical protein